MKILSICIFAYKQTEQIKGHLDEISAYDGNDIEVVVSDDTQDDSIKDLVASYYDNRFRYVKNTLGAGADGNYLNAIMSAESEYVWIFRSSDRVLPDRIEDIINLFKHNPGCTLFFPSTIPGEGLITRTYNYEVKKEIWHSGTLHPSGYIVNKNHCDFDLYKNYITKYFDDFNTSNVAFNLLQADLGLKGDTCFSDIRGWKYIKTVNRTDKAENAPGGKNPFGLEFEYKRYALMLDYASNISDEKTRLVFIKKVIHTYAKQILHVFGKRNSSEAFLKHYGCEKVEFNPYSERKIFISETEKLLKNYGIELNNYRTLIKKEAFVYGVIKPTIYKIRNK